MLFFLPLILILPLPVYAQTTLAVDIRKAEFTWAWVPGNGGAVEEFRIKCGAALGTYTITKAIADPAARSYPVLGVVPSVGNYFCVISVANQFGESPNSAEVSFNAGDIPPGVTSWGVVTR